MTILGSLSQAIGLAGGSQQLALDSAKLKAEYMKMQAQAQQAQLTWASQNAYQNPIEPPKAKLDEGAWDIAITQLVDLWVVRHGSKWVKQDELDEFYNVAVMRLQKLNKIEQHYVNGTNVYRIVE